MAKAVRLAGLTAVGLLVLVTYAPEALAFLHRARVADTSLYLVEPLRPNLAAILARSDRLVEASPLAPAA